MSGLSPDPDDEPHTHNDSEWDQEHVHNTPANTGTSQNGTQAGKRRIPKKNGDSQRTDDKEANTTKSTKTPTMCLSDKPCNPDQPATLWGQPSQKFGYHTVPAYIHHTPLTSNKLKGTRVMWTEWITPNTYDKRTKSLSNPPEATNVYLCTTMSIKSTDPSG